MTEKRHIWGLWARALHRWGLEPLAAGLLEATKPLHLVGAQLLYAGQPVLGVFLDDSHTEHLARTLEEPEETAAFVAFLREGSLS